MKNEVLNEIQLHKKMVNELESGGIERILRISENIVNSLRNNGTLYICGNGGSAADAQHIAGEFIGRFREDREALPAVSLSTDTSVLTCIGNDYDFNEIFKRQVEAYIKPGDILWALSTSGSSLNIIKAVKVAKEIGATIVSFTGISGSKLEKLSTHNLSVNTKITSTVQEIHQISYHIICKLVEKTYFNK